MSKLPWKPWNKVLSLREELRSRDLAMNLFAADLYDVVMQKASPVYGDPREFFAQTYPTYAIRHLARDVVLRLARENDKAVRQLALTYGGGKTHTLITLYHLVHDPRRLPDLPAVGEFLSTIGRSPPRARVAVLPFDKLDVEKGMEVRGPAGEVRRLFHPWSALAFQLAGAEGLRALHAEGLDAERETPPAEPLLKDLLAVPAREGLATLVLLDETLMYVRLKVSLNDIWRARLIDFFQYLTQAVTKVPGCCLVGSLLASEARPGDPFTRELTNELHAIFRRQQEEIIQPVQKEDVAEVLRRRFFLTETLRDREGFRAHVAAAVKGIQDLDDPTRRDGTAAEVRYLQSYPFHPELNEVFYTRWTQLESFQRTRGILRIYALALRDAMNWDPAPLIGPGVFLGRPGQAGLSEAARELTNMASTEEHEGRRQDWASILEGELAKARDLQAELPGLGHRELEQAVFATFLHSQPIDHKAATRDLMLLLGATRPDKIELEKGLRRWSQESWFLDDEARADASEGGLPRWWRLGLRPNLTQMHHDACGKVQAGPLEDYLLGEIRKVRSLAEVRREDGVRVHLLPERPRDIEDDGDFHFAVLGPKVMSSSGNPSAEATRFLDEKTGPGSPRVYRNAVMVVVPSRDGLEAVKGKVREHLGWLEVRRLLEGQEIDEARRATLERHLDQSRREVGPAIQQAYCIVVCVSEKNEAQAFKLNVTGEPLFQQIKTDPRSRIQEQPVAADALLPGGPYDLWREGETTRRVKDLAGAFAQLPHLPRMLRAREIVETLVRGACEGWFVLRLTRTDRSQPTFWRQAPPEAALRDPSLEVVLPEHAELSEVPPALLAPGELPGLWRDGRLCYSELLAYFAGGHVVSVPRTGYEEPLTIPKAPAALVERGVLEGVREGKLWLLAGQASVWKEEVPAGLLAPNSLLLAPPAPLNPAHLLPEFLPDLWRPGVVTPSGLLEAVSAREKVRVPWMLLGAALDGALHTRLLERMPDSGPWPCSLADAGRVKVRLPQESSVGSVDSLGSVVEVVEVPPHTPRPGRRVAEAELQHHQFQEFAERFPEVVQQAVGHNLRIVLRLQLEGEQPISAELLEQLNLLLAEVSPALRFR